MWNVVGGLGGICTSLKRNDYYYLFANQIFTRGIENEDNNV
jgi:hypothetical protein